MTFALGQTPFLWLKLLFLYLSVIRFDFIMNTFDLIPVCLCFLMNWQLIPLSELSPEYQTVAGYVKNDGLLDRRFISISRIQNLDLWEFYCR